MADNVIFKTGALSNLDSVTKKAGQVLFAIDGNNRAYISFDKDANTRCDLYVKVADEATTLTGLTVSAVDLNDINNKAPTSHASSATTYGKGTSSAYGHLKLSDAINSTSSTSSGVAATPKAVKTAYDLANTKANKQDSLYYIEGTGDTAGTWLGSHDDITEYYAGLTIAYKVGIAGVSGGTTLNINSLGAVAVIRNTSSAVTTHYGVSVVIILTYTVDSTGIAYWKVADYDSDTKARSSDKASTKMYIIGAQNQSSSGQTTYSNSKCYIGTDNCLYSNGSKVALDSDLSTLNTTVNTTINSLTISGKTITYTTVGGTSGTLTTQDTNTHYIASLVLGATSSSSSNATTTTLNPYLNLREDSTIRSSIQITGGTNISVSGINGIISIRNTYTLPTASSTILGGVKVGDNINLLDGVISLNSSNVISALGYTPVNKAGDTMTSWLYVKGDYIGVRFKTDDGTNVRSQIFAVPQETNGSGLRFGVKATNSDYWEFYTLPYSSNITGHKYYSILTTRDTLTVAQGGTGATSGVTALKNLGLEIQCGYVTEVSTSTNGQTVTFATAFSTIPVVVVSGTTENTSSVYVHNVSKTGFTIKGATASKKVYWIAVVSSASGTSGVAVI